MNVYGRPLGKQEMRFMDMARRVSDYVIAQEQAGEKATWRMSHPEEAKLIDYARTCALEMKLIDG